MRRIERSSRFKRGYKRETKGQYRLILDQELHIILTALVQDLPLPDRYRDHSMVDTWKDHRDCYLRPDLVLIYRKVDTDILQLVRRGSHSELGLF